MKHQTSEGTRKKLLMATFQTKKRKRRRRRRRRKTVRRLPFEGTNTEAHHQ